MTQIILTDEDEICWKFYVTKDMKLGEILTCIDKQFYAKDEVKE